jgi:hypothetical protein
MTVHFHLFPLSPLLSLKGSHTINHIAKQKFQQLQISNSIRHLIQRSIKFRTQWHKTHDTTRPSLTNLLKELVYSASKEQLPNTREENVHWLDHQHHERYLDDNENHTVLLVNGETATKIHKNLNVFGDSLTNCSFKIYVVVTFAVTTKLEGNDSLKQPLTDRVRIIDHSEIARWKMR